MPEKEQFKSGEAFYGTLFHEMTHISVVGVQDKTLSEYVRDAVAMLKNMQ